MEKINYKVLSSKGKEVGSIDLDARVFGAPIRQDIIHATVVWQQNKKRSGTHSTINKGAYEGSSKKPYKQKGTGRARAGGVDSPVWVGGAVAHGPQPRKYISRVTKRARYQAMLSALSSKCADKQIVIIDDLSSITGKTSEMSKVIKTVGASDKKSLVISSDSVNLERASRNLDRVTSLSVDGLNVYDLMNNELLICTRAGVQAIQSRMLGGVEEAEA